MASKVAFTLALSSSVALLAQGTVPPSLKDWSDLTALGILAIVVVFLVCKMLPDLHRKFVEQSQVFSSSLEAQNAKWSGVISTIHKDNAEILDKIHDRLHADREDTQRAMLQLATTCAAGQAAQKQNQKGQ